MLSKPGNHEQILLKFDTSIDKLACFIKRKSKYVHNQVNNITYNQSIKLTHKRSISNRENISTFKKDDFLESILTKTFTEEFACTDDIKKLVKNLEYNEQEQCSPQCNIFSNKQCIQSHKNNTEFQSYDDNYNAIISNWINNSKDNTSQHITKRTLPETIQQPINPSKSPTKQQSNILSLQLCEPSLYAYEPHFYSDQQYQNKHNLQRKKKNLPNELSKQYRIQPDKIQLDGRTTLMIRNIPNKYTQQLLLDQFNKNFKVKFDFFYLPIDYYNSCNIGYAFINFTQAKYIFSFYNQFNGKKWTRFNSEKICQLTYARIQGTGALRNHFKNSHLMQQKDRGFKTPLNQFSNQQKVKENKIGDGEQWGNGNQL